MIQIQRISENELSKQEWCFDIQGTNLIYRSHFIYNRSNRREKWADEKPEPKSFNDWCIYKGYKNDDFDFPYGYGLNEEYKEYKRSMNPILQKTKSGKPKLSGISAQIKDMPKCPQDVALEAKKVFCKQLKVIY